MSKKSGKKVVLAGLAVALAAGSYFLYGKKGQERRKKIEGWMLKMKGDILSKIEKINDIGKDKYIDVVDSVSKKYKKVQAIENKEIDQLARELKKHWQDIEKELKGFTEKKKK